MSLVALALALAVGSQDPAEAWIERLASDSAADRDEAERRLLALGAAAGPALRRAAKGADSETALRLGFLLRVLDLRDSLPAPLLAAIPGVEVRLARGRLREVFLEASDRARHPGLRAEDVEALGPPAFDGPLTTEERQELCRRAGWRRLRSCVPALAQLLADPASAGAAGEALVAIGTPEAVTAYVEGGILLQSWRRVNLSLNLPALDRGAVRKGLLRALRHERPDVRFQAASLLSTIEAPEGAGELVRGLKAENREIRLESAAALARLRRNEGLPVVLGILGDPQASQSERLQALQALPAPGSPEALDLVARLLDVTDIVVRREAAETLGRIGGAGAVGRLGRLLDDPAWDLRAAAVKALDTTGSPAANPLLERALSDANVFVRGPALRSLARREGARRLPEILSFVQRPSFNDSVDAARALAQLPREAWLPQFREWAREGKALGKLSDCLWCLEDPGPAPDLLPHFEAADEDLKERMAQYFASVRFREAVPALEAFFPRSGETQRPWFAEYLCLLGSRAGVDRWLEEARGNERKTLTCLNLVRSPAVGRDLHRIRIELPERIAVAGVWSAIADRLKLRLELPETASWEEEWVLREPQRIEGEQLAWDLLDQLAEGTDYETILEEGRLRVLARPRAIEFWKAWAVEARK